MTNEARTRDGTPAPLPTTASRMGNPEALIAAGRLRDGVLPSAGGAQDQAGVVSLIRQARARHALHAIHWARRESEFGFG